ncbi:hypothetical protein DPMN_119111 [Dreissena polymorpha]|uniref:Uncharacterized protein n=1 Tax=Dreissena polymorpha TaxID=45954 RepID=A0A9D4GIP4_DREPO|nr:hypothetical protein DPMN_119111 [Dreissena polymorpha]
MLFAVEYNCLSSTAHSVIDVTRNTVESSFSRCFGAIHDIFRRCATEDSQQESGRDKLSEILCALCAQNGMDCRKIRVETPFE